MNYNRPIKNDSAFTLKVMCAVVFVVFCFFWLYFFQGDLLAVAQHVLSGGKTHYSRFIGSVLITVVLWLLQLVAYGFIRLNKRTHALTYLPSMLALAMISSVNEDIDQGFSFGVWLWLFPLLLVLWIGMAWAFRFFQGYESQAYSGLFSRRMWINMVLMVVMMVGVALAGNTNAVFHYRAHAETALLEGDFDEALRVGNRSLETDGNLMMLRMYALSRKGQLGERLFHYSVVTTSDAMLPTGDDVRLLRYSADSLYRHLGARPRRPMRPMDYLTTILRSGQAKPAVADYLLCGYLIDKDLDSFAREIGRFYTVDENLPLHYREALVLYNHLRSHPQVVYHDAVLDTDYADLQKLEAQYSLPSHRKGKVLEDYANSYWYYYEYVGR